MAKEAYQPVIHEEELMTIIQMMSFLDDITYLNENDRITEMLSRKVEQIFEIKDPFLKVSLYGMFNRYELEISENVRYNFTAGLKQLSTTKNIMFLLTIIKGTNKKYFDKFESLFKSLEVDFITYFLESTDHAKWIHAVEVLQGYRIQNYSKFLRYYFSLDAT